MKYPLGTMVDLGITHTHIWDHRMGVFNMDGWDAKDL